MSCSESELLTLSDNMHIYKEFKFIENEYFEGVEAVLVYAVNSVAVASGSAMGRIARRFN